MTTSRPASSRRFTRKPSRAKRFTRFRETAVGSCLRVTDKPRRANPRRFGAAITSRHRSPERRGLSKTRLKSCGLSSRCCRENPCGAVKPDSGAQSRPAFCSARIQYFPPATGLHTRPETVGTLTLDFAWLVGSFHDLTLTRFGSLQKPCMLRRGLNNCQ